MVEGVGLRYDSQKVTAREGRRIDHARMNMSFEVIAIGGWTLTALVLAGIGLLTAQVSISESRRLKRLRADHVQTHPPMPGEKFSELAGVQADRGHVAAGFRNGVAEAMGVAPETVYPSDRLDYVMQFSFDNMDFCDISIFAGKALNVRIPDSFWKPLFPAKRKPRDVSLGELARFAAENWDSLSALQAKRSKRK